MTGLVTSQQHNGKEGTVCAAIDSESDRIGVAFDGGLTLRIKACNLLHLSQPGSPVFGSDSPIPASHSFASTSELGLPFVPLSDRPLQPSHSGEPPAPEAFISWERAARAQSFSFEGLAPPHLSKANIARPHNPPSFLQLFSTVFLFPTLKCCSNIVLVNRAPLPLPRTWISSSLERIISATLFPTGLNPQMLLLSSLTQHPPLSSCGC